MVDASGPVAPSGRMLRIGLLRIGAAVGSGRMLRMGVLRVGATSGRVARRWWWLRRGMWRKGSDVGGGAVVWEIGRGFDFR